MIITRTPYRVSFLGGGSDLPAFYEKHAGQVLSTSINQYMYISIHPCFNPHEVRVKYSRYESVTDIDELEHPIAKVILKKHKISGVEITSVGDIPAQTGLGSSSAFTVGLLKAVYAYKGISISNEDIAKEACDIEINLLNQPIGKQDQYASAIGGLNYLSFAKNGEVGIKPIHMNKSALLQLQNNLVLFYTGKSRSATQILARQSENIAADNKKFDIQLQIAKLVPGLIEEIERGDVTSFGRYLDQGWKLKRQLTKSTSTDDIDSIYDLALKNGAKGGKILGAGGGGFFLFYCPSEKQEALISALGMKPTYFEFDTKGSQIIYSSDNLKSKVLEEVKVSL